MKFLLFIFLFMSSFLGKKEIISMKGNATYYASKFEGRRTTSGEIFRNNKLTAAHKKLPFGTMVTVRNLNNDKIVVVMVNDRGPYGKGMIIDLSQSAAKEIDLYGKGVVPCEISYELQK
nr:septal ring lytic transglycosylase RlpA family protein [Pseudopedobacter sp.]